ncbi:expressed unknown protein [Seminavis robusta]|uniref:CRAL-TRIO domain-containing protein n=1 Tax=Seminavis robusta TaxID=568900 RepID=A0A9N8E5B5_9STRA|nr:expressed unknown protein [Seminavis robusta]|eukprot:Sro688_g187340.1 n/a (314) ;mRNA; r:8281-9222
MEEIQVVRDGQDELAWQSDDDENETDTEGLLWNDEEDHAARAEDDDDDDNNDYNARSKKRKSRDDDEEEEGLGILMVITAEERQWAETLQEALEQREDCGHITISNMELVQHAIVEEGNIEKAIERIKRMHEFRLKYQIEDTVEQGEQCIRDFMEQQPGFSLNLDQCVRHNHFVHVIDFAKFNPRKVYLPKDWKVFLSGIHYYLSALNPTLSAVRNGVLGIMECEGMGWHNFCLDFERRLWYEHAGAYPAKFHEISWVRSPLVANVFFSLLKPIMNDAVRKVVHLGVLTNAYEGRSIRLFLNRLQRLPTREKS